MSRVSIRRLVKRYGAVTAIRGIDLDVEEGEFVVLLGPSGCGKTTTLRCVAGLEDVSGGTIHIGDTLVSSETVAVAPEKRKIGMVFQSYAIWPHMSVNENVAFGLALQKIPRAEVERRVREVLDLVGLKDYGDRGASQLSGGQQQRVALARAIVLEPRLLLFDEPLSNLDAKLRERMRFELRQLQQRLGITSIYVTHDQQEAMVIADRVVLMHNGDIVQIGSPTEIYNRPTSLFGAEFIGLANIIPGQVTSSDGPTRVAIPGGHELVSSDTGVAPGTSVDVICRPEQVRVSSTPLTGENAFKARITSGFYLGNFSDVYLDIGGVEIRTQISPPPPWSVGQELWVHLPKENVILLEKHAPAVTSTVPALAHA